MTTRILDADIILNSKEISLLNTDMDIYIEWDIEIKKHMTSADIFFKFESVHGNFNIYEQKELYKKKINIEFRTDSSWLIEMPKNNAYNILDLQPIMSTINFDDKRIIITI